MILTSPRVVDMCGVDLLNLIEVVKAMVTYTDTHATRTGRSIRRKSSFL